MKTLRLQLHELKYDCLWLCIARKYYKGLYKELGNPYFLEKYYHYLHWHISNRGE